VEEARLEKTRSVAEVNRLLVASGDLGARWWQYTASLSAFELLVGEPTDDGNLILVLASCSFLSGPVAWSQQRLSVRMNELAPGELNAGVFEVRDESANFIARSSMFSFKRGWNLLERGSVMFPRGWRSSGA
jgi:hypothetical protein